MKSDWLILTIVVGAMATPALASAAITPAPIAGMGVGAVLLMGLGYRAMRRRIDR